MLAVCATMTAKQYANVHCSIAFQTWDTQACLHALRLWHCSTLLSTAARLVQ
jgi:hypothetical protein